MKKPFIDITDFWVISELRNQGLPKKKILKYIFDEYFHLLNLYQYIIVRIYDSEYLIFSKKHIIEQKVIEL